MCGQDLKVILRRKAHGLNGIHHKVECEDPFGTSVDERVVDTRDQQVRNDGGEPGTGPQDHPFGGVDCRHRFVTRGRLNPQEPPACDEAVAAIHAAEWVILGPGSWFTSVIPHLLVPGIHDALINTRAKRVLTLNLVMNTVETVGFSAKNHLEVLAAHAPELRLDAVSYTHL